MPDLQGIDTGEFTRILEDLYAQPDRGAAIIAAALADEALTMAMEARLRFDAKLKKRLFSAYGPLSTFSGRIDVAAAVGLVSVALRSDLNSIRDIRNKFAHSIKPLDFDEPQISDLCGRLSTATSFARNRERYIVACGRATMLLSVVSTFGIKVPTVAEDQDVVRSVDMILRHVTQGAATAATKNHQN